jgi:hypothetical protein
MTNTNTLPRVRPISTRERNDVRLFCWDYVIDIAGETYPISLSTAPADSEDVTLTATFTPSGDPIQVVYTPDFDVYRMLLK